MYVLSLIKFKKKDYIRNWGIIFFPPFKSLIFGLHHRQQWLINGSENQTIIN
jgi:hypothetical protein